MQRAFGGHTWKRLAHVGDRTGLEMIRTLQDKGIHSGMDVYMECTITHLLKDGERISGAFGYWRESGRFVLFKTKAVILATGGVGKSYKVTSNSWEYTGDGQALAYDAGADLIDMEFIQFHPTGMVWPPSVKGILVTEAVRGEGGTLTNRNGERFMEKYDPQRMEHSTRDVVARSIYTEVMEGRGLDEIIETVVRLAPSFGGVNLEDISAPRCFEIEKRLQERLDIPVFHDDQHGTAVVTLAALRNAAKLTGRGLGDLRAVISGAGAAGVAIAKMLLEGGLGEVRMSHEILSATLTLRSFLFEAVYENPRATAEFEKASGILGGLWEKVHARPAQYLDGTTMELEGIDAAARDFLAGMTDRYAVALFEELFVPRSWSRL